jgi:hypothetical protein
MFNLYAYAQTTFLSFLIIWILAVGFRNFTTGVFKLGGFKFSIKNYYLFVSGFAVYPILRSLELDSLKPLLIFAFFGLAGMAFEILASEWWAMFYKNRVYSYTVETVDHKFSSWLNIIPWGGAGLLYLAFLEIIKSQLVSGPILTSATNPELPFYYIFIAAFLAGLVFQMLLWVTFILQKRHDHKFIKVTWSNFSFFVFPFALAMAACAAVYGGVFIILALLFGVVASVFEYLFGRAAEWIISKKLWTYNHPSLDRGHISPVTLFGFSLAGFYFWAVALILQQVIR